MTTTTAALAPVVDALVRTPVEELCVSELQALLGEVVPQLQRLEGLVSLAAGQLQALTGGMVATPEGGHRSVAGWLAEATRTSVQTAGHRVAKAMALRELPLVVDAVLDGVLSQEQAAVLARLVGKIPAGALLESQENLILVAAPLDPVQLGAYVAHLIATHVEPAVDADEAAVHDRAASDDPAGSGRVGQGQLQPARWGR